MDLRKLPYKTILFLAIPLLSILMHWNIFNLDLMSMHVWRQTQTQSNIVNFYEEDFNILNPRRNERGDGDGIFRMEFPIMQWSFAVLHQAFGEHIRVSRIASFVIGLFSIWGMYYLLWHLFQIRGLALIGAWCLNFSPAFYYYTINPLPDNLALCCAIWALSFFYAWRRNPKWSSVFWIAVLFCCSTLAKLPFVLFLFIPIASLLYEKRYWKMLLSMLSLQFFPLLWYSQVIPQWKGNGIVQGILMADQAWGQLLDYLQHNLISTLPELLINYAAVPFFLAGIYFFLAQKLYRKKVFLPIGLSFLSIVGFFLFELNMIAKVHDYYLFPFLIFIFMLVSYGAWQLWESQRKYARTFVIVALAILPLTCWLRMSVRWNPENPGFNKDLLVHKEALREAVPDDALCVVGNDYSHYIFFYYIHKKGWGFENDQLSPTALDEIIAKGAHYLYTDSRAIDENPAIRKRLKELIVEKASIKVYRLQKPDQ